MANDVARHWRLSLPADRSPGGYWCVTFAIPAGDDYVTSLAAALGELTLTKTWERDPTRTGALEVAHTWERALYLRPMQVLEFDCEFPGREIMNITNLRTDPLRPCVLQAQFEGSSNWIDVGDFSCCSGGGGDGCAVLQYDGRTINRYDPGTGTFVPVAPQFDPSTSGTFTSLYDALQDGACNGAANITAYINHLSHVTLSSMATGGAIEEVAGYIAAAIATFAAGLPVLGDIIGFIAGEIQYSTTLLNDADATDITTEFKNILYRGMRTDGTIREPEFTATVTALFARRDQEAVDTAPRIKWGHMANLLSFVGPYVASNHNKYAGILDADCSAAEWQAVFDFTLTPNAFAAIPEDIWPNTGYYSYGQGWIPSLAHANNGEYGPHISISRSFPSTQFTYLAMVYDAVHGVDTYGSSFASIIGWGVAVPTGETNNQPIVTGNDQLIEFVLGPSSDPVVRIEGRLTTGAALYPTSGGGSGRIKKIIARGTGTNPFLYG